MSESNDSSDNESTNINQEDNQTEKTEQVEIPSGSSDIREVIPHTLPGRPDTRW